MDTYEEIYQKMKSEYENQTGNTFNEESDIAVRFRVLAGEVYNVKTSMEWMKRQMFSATAGGEYLDYLASQRGLSRKQPQKSKGQLVFRITEPTTHSIVIPKGTVVATADSAPVRFVTLADKEISSGQLSASVYAEAEKAGRSGNINLNKAVIAVSVPAEIASVTNSVRFSGGEDIESDDELRARIKDSYLNQSNGTNKAYYEQLALSVEGISKAGVVGKARGAGTVNVYVSGNDTEASDTAVASAQTLLSKSRELNVDVLVQKAQIASIDLNVAVWAKSGYSASEVKSKCSAAFRKYISSLPVGGRMYLTALGNRLMETGCIENYQYNVDMTDTECSISQCFSPGTVYIKVM